MNEQRHKAAGVSEKMRVSHEPLCSARVDTGSLEPMESPAASDTLLAGLIH